MTLKKIIFLTFCLGAAACAPVMEANRPSPVNLDKFHPGETHMNVISEVGPPINTAKVGDNNCEFYKLYTRGPGAIGKGLIAAGEALVDVGTLGISEIAFTPAEGATRNSMHTVVFCYGPDELLRSVRESESTVDQHQ